MPRKLFALIFTMTPPAVDVVRQDDVVTGDFTPGANVTFKCFMGKENKQDVFENVQGEILEIGLRKDMAARLIGPLKVPVHNKQDAVQARRQEIEKARMRQVNSQANNLHEIANNIIHNGPEALQAVGVQRTRKGGHSSQKLTEAEEAALKADLANLSCLQPGAFKMELIRGTGIYGIAAKLNKFQDRYGKQPKVFFRKVITHVLTPEILGRKGLSAMGKRGCVQVPTHIQNVVHSYTVAVFKSLNGDLNDLRFDPDEQLTNLISNCRRVANAEANKTAGSNYMQEESNHETTDESNTSFASEASSTPSLPEADSFPSLPEGSNIMSALPEANSRAPVPTDMDLNFPGSMYPVNVATFVGHLPNGEQSDTHSHQEYAPAPASYSHQEYAPAPASYSHQEYAPAPASYSHQEYAPAPASILPL